MNARKIPQTRFLWEHWDDTTIALGDSGTREVDLTKLDLVPALASLRRVSTRAYALARRAMRVIRTASSLSTPVY